MTFNGLKISELSAKLAGRTVLQGINFQLQKGNVLAVLGPSGCGKSTLLKIIAGIVQPTCGNITWGSVDISKTPAHKRGVGLMFQNNALFPHMNVQENVRFGLEMLSVSKEEANDRTIDLLELVGLKGYGNRAVDTLSGGESQRVALARVLAPEPKVVLLDEPLAALDPLIIQDIQKYIMKIQSTGTAILVTDHNVKNLFDITDRSYVLGEHTVIAEGTSREILRSSKAIEQYFGSQFS